MHSKIDHPARGILERGAECVRSGDGRSGSISSRGTPRHPIPRPEAHRETHAGGGGVLPRLVVGLRVWVRLLLAVQAVLAASPVAVVLERAEVVAGSGLGAVPVVALGPLPPHEGGGGLREEVVLVLRVVVAAQAEDGLLDDVLPAALLGEVQGLLCRAEGKLHEHVGGHGVRTGHPSH